MNTTNTTNTTSITTHELLTILDIARRLAERHLIQPLMKYVADTVFEIISAERCLIVLFAEDGTPRIHIAQDRRGQPLGMDTDQMSHSILERVRITMTPLRIGDALQEVGLKTAQSVRSLGLRSVMCVPLISYGAAIGAIYVENRSAINQFREENLVPLVLFSLQVVTAIENARLYETLEAQIEERTLALQTANMQLAQQAVELREQSIRDGLTGLYNRRYLNEILPQLFGLARRYQRPLTIACLDIDNFKQINDTFLHSGGDRVLEALARALSTSIRLADSIARSGGEEFVICMPETDLATALAVCERLRGMIEGYQWAEIAPGLHVTVSIGVASDAGCANEQELLRTADLCLYQAKRMGKNRVVVGGSGA